MRNEKLFQEFLKIITDELCISKDDLTKEELKIAEICFKYLEYKIKNISELEKECYRKEKEIKNLKAMYKDLEK